MHEFPITDTKRISEWSLSASRRLSQRFALYENMTDYHHYQIYGIIINHLIDRGAYIVDGVVYLDRDLIGHMTPINKDIIVFNILIDLYYPIVPEDFDVGLGDIRGESSMIFYNPINDDDLDWFEVNVVKNIKTIESNMFTSYLWLIPSGKYDADFIRQEVKLFNQRYPEIVYDDLEFISLKLYAVREPGL